MPKKKKIITPKVKKHSSKYSKLAAVCSKELAAKKKALVLAEKRLANAQKTHQELLSEVARLDMLDRSLNALIQGTEPPQNVKYVYTYPQWVWYPNNPGSGWWYNNGTITLGSPQTFVGSNLQGGSSLYTNAQNSNYTVNNGGPNVTLTGFNSSSIQTAGMVTSSGNLNLCTTNTGTAETPTLGTITIPSSLTNPTYEADGSLTVDLTTHAMSDEQEEAFKASTKTEKADAEADLVSA